MPSHTIINRKYQSNRLAITGNTETPQFLREPVAEGLVVDLILDHTHPDYSFDGYNVGSIRVRMFLVDNAAPEDVLSWADPLDYTIQEMPLIGELVMIHVVRGNFFYTRKVALAKQLQQNAMIGMNRALSGETLAEAIVSEEERSIQAHRFGEYYRPDSRVRKIKHFEGDTIYSGRMGQSIRFGSSQMDQSSDSLAPNIILRSGQARDAHLDASTEAIFGLIVEDANHDPSSLWLVSDQIIPFVPSTVNADSFVRSIQEPAQTYDGAQILLTSDRVVLNSKLNGMELFSNKHISLNSLREIGIDTDSYIALTAARYVSIRSSENIIVSADENCLVSVGNDIVMSARNKTSFLADKIYVGSISSEDEPLVGGTTLAMFLEEFINAHTSPAFHALTATGPARLHPQVIANLTALRAQLRGMNDAVFNSEDNFVSLQNDLVEVEPNDFAQGATLEHKLNEWKLEEEYYRVQ